MREYEDREWSVVVDDKSSSLRLPVVAVPLRLGVHALSAKRKISLRNPLIFESFFFEWKFELSPNMLFALDFEQPAMVRVRTYWYT